MSLTINIYYTGAKGSARAFAEEMVTSGIVADIRAKEGNLRYEYFFPMDDPGTVLLIDQWRDQEALDAHHESDTMQRIAELRNKYDLHMRVERFVSDESDVGADRKYIRDLDLSEDEMGRIKALDLGRPQMLDTRKPEEVWRVYDYLNNPVVTSLD